MRPLGLLDADLSKVNRRVGGGGPSGGAGPALHGVDELAGEALDVGAVLGVHPHLQPLVRPLRQQVPHLGARGECVWLAGRGSGQQRRRPTMFSLKLQNCGGPEGPEVGGTLDDWGKGGKS